jgi:Domain of unknown function (DUF1707)
VDIRASDEDRQRVVAALERHTGAGRLTLDEFAARVEVACGARTLDELAAVTSDLPTSTGGGAAPDEGPRRELLLLFLVAAVALVLLAVGLALR